ncbi:MFS transporter [Angustibacter luteus]|uniref:MFS transporter n=1 Tax=Angustibacter luteus TaxID=658456 RepID=A0ABW1JIL3_9ACTN
MTRTATAATTAGPAFTGSAAAFVALAAGGFAIGTTEFVTMGLLPQIAQGMDVSIPAAGRIISAYALGVVVGAPLLAVLTARVSRTRLLLVLMAAFTVGNVASALAPNYPALMIARFLTGLPHGAYFGIAALVAASMAEPGRRGRAVVLPMLGLTAANVFGVPASAFLGEQYGWRSAYWFVAAVGVITMVLVWLRVPFVAALEGAAPREELRALAKPQVWLTLMIGAVGFGGMFAVYSYIAPILTHTSGWSTSAVPIALATFGIGMTFGTLAGGRLADWSVPRALLLGFAATLVTLLAFPFAARSTWGVAVEVLMLGFVTSATVGALQLRLMDVAGSGAASLGASLNHSSLNLANASGAFFGGIVIDAGYGWTSPALVGSAMAATGLVLSAISVLAQRRSRRRRAFEAHEASELSGAAA